MQSQWEDDFLNESIKDLGQDNDKINKQDSYEESKEILAKISQPVVIEQAPDSEALTNIDDLGLEPELGFEDMM